MLKCLLTFIVFFVLLFFSVQAQVQRDCFTSSGLSSSGQVVGLVVHQSIGQGSVIGNHMSERLTLRQGFLQPHIQIYRTGEAEKSELQVFPNPFRETVQVEFSKTSDEVVRFSVFSATGALLKSFKGTMHGTVRLNLSGLARGLYILQVDTEQGLYTTKIQKL